MSFRVFLSYSAADELRVESLARVLDQCEIVVAKLLESSDAAIGLLSSSLSPEVLFDLGRCIGRGLPVLLVGKPGVGLPSAMASMRCVSDETDIDALADAMLDLRLQRASVSETRQAFTRLYKLLVAEARRTKDRRERTLLDRCTSFRDSWHWDAASEYENVFKTSLAGAERADHEQAESDLLRPLPLKLEAVDRLLGFELQMALFLALKGFEVDGRRASIESGYDFELTLPHQERPLLVECKSLPPQAKVSVEHVRRLAEAVTLRGASGGVFISTSQLTAAAAALVSRKDFPVSLCTLDDLLNTETVEDVLRFATKLRAAL